MKKIGVYLLYVLLIGAATAVGMTQGALYFSDFSAGENVFTRTALSVSIAIMSGVVFGFFLPRAWWLSAVAVWMLILFTFGDVMRIIRGDGVSDGELLFIMRLLPIVVVLIAAYFGARANKLKHPGLAVLAVFAGIIGMGATIFFTN